MKITVINGTEKHGVTYRMKEIFLEEFRKDAQITEYYLPKDCPGFCIGCTQCFREKEHLCKDAAYTQRIEKSLLEADLLVFTSPAYVFLVIEAMADGAVADGMPRDKAYRFAAQAVATFYSRGADSRALFEGLGADALPFCRYLGRIMCVAMCRGGASPVAAPSGEGKQ